MSSKALRTYLNDHVAGSVATQRLQAARVALTAEP